MRKLIVFLSVVFSLISATCAQKPLSMFFSPYYDEDTGMAGVQYGDEICLLPQFEDVSFERETPYLCSSLKLYANVYDNSDGYFAFKEKGKWGLSSIYCKILPARFDRIRSFISYPLLIVKENGKERIIGESGIEMMTNVYDSISAPLRLGDELLAPNNKQNRLLYADQFYLAFDGDKVKLIDMFGTVFDDDVKLQNLTKEYKEENKKSFKKWVSSIAKFHKDNPDYLTQVYEKKKESVSKFGTKARLGEQSGEPAIFQTLEGNKYLLKGTEIYELDPQYEYKTFKLNPTWFSPEEILGNPFFLFGKDRSWGVMAVNGEVIIPAEYNYIELFEGGKLKEFTAGKMGKSGVLNLLGEITVPFNYKFIFSESFGNQEYFPKAGSDNSYDYYIGGKMLGDSENGLREKYYEVVNSSEYKQKQLEIETKLNSLKNETSNLKPAAAYNTIDNIEIALTDYGLDLVPLVENSPQLRLRRNPASLVGLTSQIFDGKDFKSRQVDRNDIADLRNLAALAYAMGYEDSDYWKQINEEANRVDQNIKDLEEARARDQRIAERNAMIDAISGALVNALNSAADAFASGGTVIDADGNDTNSANSSGSSSKSSKLSSNVNRLADNQAYNTDKRSYANYDSMVSAAKAGNRKASDSEIKEWKNKMKKLRLKWEQKGKSFPHSSNEN